VTGYKIVDCGTEGEERVDAFGTMLVESDFMQVWVCSETA